ncbi:hypothetical protein HDA36_004569 [Nocardiopsis composta]|uniref:Uncharacterized protein n=1 Tax=Nocardiopsis composta TaxID=157465 RepID=A0A7W8VFU4_9ACTN|nr:hypothetical protein [Nocardiopsis composta]
MRAATAEEGAGRLTRVRRFAGWGFKRAATAEEGAGRASPAGCGVSRGRGSNRRRRRGRGGPSHSGAAFRGVGARAGGNGEGSSGPGAPGRARRLSGWGFGWVVFAVRVCAFAGRVWIRGRRRSASPAGEVCPECRIVGGGRAGVEWSAHLGGGPDDVYRRVAPLGSRPHPPLVTQGDETGSVEGACGVLAPSAAPSRFPAPSFPPSGRLGSPITAPIAAIRGPGGPIRPRMRAPTSQGRRRGVQAAPPCLHCPCLPRSGGFGDLWSAGPGRRGDADAAPPPPVCPFRPPCRRRPPPRPRRLLNPDPVGCRARPRRPAPPLPLPSPSV